MSLTGDFGILGLELDIENDRTEVESESFKDSERDKRDVYCDKQAKKVVTVLNCMLKGSWEEGGSRVSERN